MKRGIGMELAVASVLMGLAMLTPSTGWAHCDTMNGPVIPEARAALEKGDVTPILKWVKKDKEEEIKAAFVQAVAVRAKGAEAKELADKYFLETLVRLHREGEGAPYTGLKDEPVKRIVAISDQAVADGSADEMVKRISGHLATAIGEKFAKVVEARKHKDKSVEAGRAYVEAYVDYTHYVEGIHAAIMSAGGHGHAPAAGHAEKAAPVEHAH